MRGQKIKNAIRSVLFILVFFILLYTVNGLLAEKWWYPMFGESPAYQYREFYETDLCNLQAVFLGTSHMEFAVDPMKIYIDKGYVTYNMASSGQPIEASYYVLEEIFRYSNPSYVFFDVSRMISAPAADSSYRLILENLQWGLPKLNYTTKWIMLNDADNKHFERLVSAFFPIVQYHDRWKSLTEQDFENESGKRKYYRKGFYPRTVINNTQNTTVDWMNEIAQIKYEDDIKNTIIDHGEESIIEGVPGNLYHPEISANAQEIVLKMKKLCQKHHAQLVLVKVPSVRPPQIYAPGWTKIKSDIVKEFSLKAGIVFLDLLYDYDIAIDWENDTCDSGIHLNYQGSRKATQFFEMYLAHLGLKSIRNATYEEDIGRYNMVCEVAELESVRGFNEYFRLIQKMKNISILISVRDDMRRNLSLEDINILQEFGIQTDIEKIQYNDAFAVLIENGEVVYEETSNGSIDHIGQLIDGNGYEIVSSGYLADDESKIRIDNKEYSSNKRGLNIVIYDHISGLVIDSCTFDTWATDKPMATRTLGTFPQLFHNYEEWCMHHDYTK